MFCSVLHSNTHSFYKYIIFWAKAWYCLKKWTLRLRSFLKYSYFCYYYGRILLFFSIILQIQPQGIPRMFLIFTKSQPDILINFILIKNCVQPLCRFSIIRNTKTSAAIPKLRPVNVEYTLLYKNNFSKNSELRFDIMKLVSRKI